MRGHYATSTPMRSNPRSAVPPGYQCVISGIWLGRLVSIVAGDEKDNVAALSAPVRHALIKIRYSLHLRIALRLPPLLSTLHACCIVFVTDASACTIRKRRLRRE